MPYDTVPAECLAAFSKNAKHMDDEVVATICRIVAGYEPDEDLDITEVSRPIGQQGRQWILVDAQGYKLWFYWMMDKVNNCFAAKTPKGVEYMLDKDGGNVFSHLTVPIIRRLNNLIEKAMPPDQEQTSRKVDVKPAWVVVIDADTDHWNRVGQMYNKGPNKKGVSFPMIIGHNLFYEEEEARRAADAYETYRQHL